ncbi:MAG: class I SAM-dependent methyltransferase [Bryobacteraceae bacterium]|jgi:SAM-dependent methyltransferase
MTQAELGELIARRMTDGGPPALDIGCGLKRAEPGAIGMDWSEESGAEVVWDVDRYPWPLPDGVFGRVHMSHIIEHMDDIVRGMKEVHRVCRTGADVFITTPHFSSHNSYTDPSHRHHLSAATFKYFTDRRFATFLSPRCGFDLVGVELTFGGNFVLDGLGRLIARRSLKWYERRCAWILPASDIRAHLRTL